MSEEIWYKNPSVLIEAKNLTRFFPSESMSKVEKLNAMVRFSLYLSILLFMNNNDYNNFYIFLIVLGMTYLMYSNKKYGGDSEKLKDENYTYTTDNNPMKNLLVSEMGTDKAYYYKGDDRKEIKENLNKGLNRKLEDFCNNQHSQRQWVTVPSETEGDFARFLYDMPSCKSGDKDACARDIEYRYNFR